jgi:hypothetical protein
VCDTEKDTDADRERDRQEKEKGKKISKEEISEFLA